jgi:para-aminobenzoate synthetase/4-amino-4-deoxychorismate lyase
MRRLQGLLAQARLTEGLGRRPAPPPLTLPAPAAAAHLTAVSRCRRRIHDGEIFQANICLRLGSTWEGRAGELLARALETVSPAYGAAFDTPDGGVASLSPELFLRRRGDAVATAPIKGTVERSADPVRAAATRAWLQRSAKDAAEHVMIVDLMRNDLGRVCQYGSVRAPREPTVEPHPGLWHLVSRVQGRLRPGVGNGELLRATFPPGSVTGAPKVQALRVISELEGTGREVYTGAIGYASPVAGLELNVAIRTLELAGGQLWLGAGGGIVADSDPANELDEALAKARPIAAAIGTAVKVADPVSREHALDAA